MGKRKPERMKPRNYFALSLLFSLVLFLASCIPVIVRAPIGGDPVQLRVDDWEGTWEPADRSAVLEVKVVDSEQGLLRAHVTSKDERGSETIVIDLHLRRVRHWMILSFRNDDLGWGNQATKGYMWARVERNGSMLLVWFPRGERFEELRLKGVITGRLQHENHPEEGDRVALEIDQLDSTALKQLQALESLPSFYWMPPELFFRTHPTVLRVPIPPKAQD